MPKTTWSLVKHLTRRIIFQHHSYEVKIKAQVIFLMAQCQNKNNSWLVGGKKEGEKHAQRVPNKFACVFQSR